MFYRQIEEPLSVSLSIPQYAEEYHSLVKRNRRYLGTWLPWVETRKTEADHRAFLLRELERFAKGESLHATVFHKGTIAGAVMFNSLNLYSGVASVGYWLGEEFTGKGIMTRVVKDLMEVGTKFYAIRRFEIAVAVGNHKSRNIPLRLGFAHEGTSRQAYRVGETWHDQEVYGLVVAK